MTRTEKIVLAAALLIVALFVAAGLAADRPASVTLSYPDGSAETYYPATQQSAPQPATLPATVPPVVTPRTRPAPAPAPQPAVVPAGADVTPYLRAARPGDTVYLARGATYPPVVAPDVRPNGVTLAGYGDAGKPRPVIASTGGDGVRLWTVDGFSLVDVTVRGTGLPAKDSAGVNLWGCRNTTLTRVEVTGHRMGVTCQSANARRSAGLTVDHCYLHDGGPDRDGVDGSGIYADETDGVRLESNLIERWGWSARYAGSERNHLVYSKPSNTGVLIAGNLLAESSSHAVQARSGGTVANNLILDCPIGISFGLVNGSGPILKGGASGDVTGNTIVGTRPLAGEGRGIGLEMSNTKAVRVSGNIFALDAVPLLPRGAIVGAVKLDVCNLTADNPARGTETLARGVVFGDNAAAWPVLYWAHPKYGATVAPAFSAADYADVRAKAERTRAEWRDKYK